MDNRIHIWPILFLLDQEILFHQAEKKPQKLVLNTYIQFCKDCGSFTSMNR